MTYKPHRQRTSRVSFQTQLHWIETHFVEIKASSQVVLDLRYATLNNFMKQNLYDGFSRCFLHPLAAEKFEQACRSLAMERPDLQFHIWDALRPRSVQARMFEKLQGGPFEEYVAPPYPGSMHNFGLALDLTLQNKHGELLEMGTDFDDFADLAQPLFEEKFLASGQLKPDEHENRMLLRRLLEDCGFKVLQHEWWHFDALPRREIPAQIPTLE